MFKNLKRRIYLIIAIMPSIFVFAVTLTAGIFTHGYLKRTFENTVYNAGELSSVTFQSRLSIMENEVELATNKEALITYVSTGENEGIAMSQLQTLANSNYILGATVYSINSPYALTSPGVSNFPSHRQLANTDFMKDFLNDDLSRSTLWLRFEHIATSYEFVNYDRDFGMVSIVSKLHSPEQQVIGYIVADLNSEYLYNNYFNFSDYQNLGQVVTFFSQDGSRYLQSATNENNNDDFVFQPEQKIERFSYAQSRYTFSLNDDFYLTIVYENKTFNHNVILWLVGLFVFNIVHGLVVFVLAKQATKKIITPLETLQEQMKEN